MEQESKRVGTATDEAGLSQATDLAEEQLLQSQSASSPDTEQDESPRRLNRRQIRDIIRGLPRASRNKYFWGRNRIPMKALPIPSNFVAFRRQLNG